MGLLVIVGRRRLRSFNSQQPVPLVYVIFDLLDNSVVLALLANYPERLDRLVVSLLYTTTIKRVASLLAIVVPLIMLGV